MTVDRPRVREQLAHINESLAGLRKLAEIPSGEYFEDFRNPRTAERLLQVAIQSMLDLSTHLVARAGLPRPETRKDLFEALARMGVLDPSRVESCRQMAGLRNLLVHEYVRIAPTQIREIIENDLDDLVRFVTDVASWMDRQTG